MKDILGNTIKIGDFVAWPSRRSSTLEMHYGRVISAEHGRVTILAKKYLGQLYVEMWTEHLERVVRVKEV